MLLVNTTFFAGDHTYKSFFQASLDRENNFDLSKGVLQIGLIPSLRDFEQALANADVSLAKRSINIIRVLLGSSDFDSFDTVCVTSKKLFGFWKQIDYIDCVSSCLCDPAQGLTIELVDHAVLGFGLMSPQQIASCEFDIKKSYLEAYLNSMLILFNSHKPINMSRIQSFSTTFKFYLQAIYKLSESA